ncbi:hypothetical protein PIB30_030567 [Stylosanthes scabra]|uniref:Uncharacterized protein n=1 Tax=Stylosanthes scabra TaxID=79078 RepID=A0ABU6TBB0_9FABA|nr:hypothetical protein [Stylosanthes scabra]
MLAEEESVGKTESPKMENENGIDIGRSHGPVVQLARRDFAELTESEDDRDSGDGRPLHYFPSLFTLWHCPALPASKMDSEA